MLKFFSKYDLIFSLFLSILGIILNIIFFCPGMLFLFIWCLGFNIILIFFIDILSDKRGVK